MYTNVETKYLCGNVTLMRSVPHVPILGWAAESSSLTDLGLHLDESRPFPNCTW